MKIRINVLDKGFVELIDYMGSDLRHVNSARISFDKRKTKIDDKDIKLINYLVKNRHTSPSRHIVFTFHIKAPLVVQQQQIKHRIGSDYTFKDSPENTISGRYVEWEPEFYIPAYFRQQSSNNKQASLDKEIELDKNCPRGFTKTIHMYEDWCNEAYDRYKSLLDIGVAREQARLVLPLSLYTEFYWTASLQAVVHFISLRDDDHAQWEIREYAKAMKSLISPIVPHSTKALFQKK